MLPQLLLDIDALTQAARLFRESANAVWLAQNPEEADSLDEVPMPLEEAQEVHSERHRALNRAEYYAEKTATKVRAMLSDGAPDHA